MTFLGFHTVPEVQDLIAAKDSVIKDIQHAYDTFESQWQQADKSAQSAWLTQWQALRARYEIARTRAKAEVDAALIAKKANPLTSGNLTIVPAEDGWNAILNSLRKKEGVVSPGDLQDLYNRLVSASKQQVNFANMQQPRKGTDADLNLFNKLEPADLIDKVKKNPGKTALIVVGAVVAYFGLFFKR